ncbi:Gag-pro-like protein [Cucumis melo var. makuwa]|uniref:Gag-pro-like protein n=1 Tax=Cucumis melo var. makuwa TaxID=1194695 RepID=A0A5D3DKR0_CUCMM|nr:Gag-pro-like protein [Cucumis melo var. makuwa]
MGQSENTPTKQKLDVLEERLSAIKGTDVYGNIDATQLCLVPGLIILAMFKISEFDKYDGSSCPRSHLTIPFRLATDGEEEFGKLQRICLTMERHVCQVYGMEAVLPLEVEIPSLRVLMEAKLDEAEWIRVKSSIDLKLRPKPVYRVLYLPNLVLELRSKVEVEACQLDPLFIKPSLGAKVDVFSNSVKSSPDLKLRSKPVNEPRSKAEVEACLSGSLFIKPRPGAKVDVFSNLVKSSPRSEVEPISEAEIEACLSGPLFIKPGPRLKVDNLF